MPLLSQDPDDRFNVFLNPIRDLTKNWEVDIAKYLEEYLEELAEIQITFDGGETLMNFAQAAMLIQGSAAVYSKKVEYLWQMVLQMLDLLSNKRTFEKKDNLDDSSIDTDRPRKSNSHAQLNFSINENLSKGKNVTIRDEDEDEDLTETSKQNNLRFLPSVPLHLVEKEGEKSTLRINLYLKKEANEVFAHKDDYRINRSYLTPRGCLCLAIPSEILKKGTTRPLHLIPDANTSIAGFFVGEEDVQTDFTELRPPEVGEGQFPLTPPQTDESPEYAADLGDDIPDLPMDDIPEIPNIDPVPEEPKIEEPIDIKRVNLRRKAAQPELLAEIPIKDPWKSYDPYSEVPKRPIRAGRIKRPPVCACHKERTKQKRRSKKNTDEESDSSKNAKSTKISVESFITKQLADKVANNNNNVVSKLETDSCLSEEIPKAQTKREEIAGQQKTKDGKSSDQNQHIDGPPNNPLNNPDRSMDVCDAIIPDMNFDAMGDEEQDFDLGAPHDDNGDYQALFSNPLNSPHKGLNESLLYEPTSDYEALVQKWVSDYVTNAQEHILSSELTKRVNRWKKTISPKLEEEEERKTFDIHDYGSHILSFFPGDDDRPIPFDTIAQNEDPKEVSRLFLSSLMLANTYNVELSQTREGDLEMDCLQLCLLSRERHHKQFEDAEAPQSTSYQPRIRRTKDKRKKQVTADDSEAGQHSPLKEMALDKISAVENVRYKRLKTKEAPNR